MDMISVMKTPPSISFLNSAKVLSLVSGGLLTCGTFVAIPLTQIATESELVNSVTAVSIYRPPPPPPPLEEIKKIEEQEEKDEDIELKKDFHKLNLATIDMALNVGSGGVGPSIYVGSFEVDDSDLDFNFVFEISELDKPPVPILQIAPVYPPDLKRAAVSGQVVAEFVVTRDGRPTRIQITHATHQEFVRPSIDAIRRWRFEPGIKDDKKVNTRVRLPFTFSIEGI